MRVFVAGFRKIPGCSGAPAHERSRSRGDCRTRCGVLRDEIEWGFECKGEAGSRLETAAIGVAGSVSNCDKPPGRLSIAA